MIPLEVESNRDVIHCGKSSISSPKSPQKSTCKWSRWGCSICPFRDIKSNFYELSKMRLWVSVANEVFSLLPFGDLQEGPFSGQFIKISPQVKIDVQVQHNDAKVLFERIFRWQLQNVLVSDSCHESQQFAIPFSVDIPQRRRTKKQILVFSQRLDFLAFLGFFLEIREVLGRLTVLDSYCIFHSTMFEKSQKSLILKVHWKRFAPSALRAFKRFCKYFWDFFDWHSHTVIF